MGFSMKSLRSFWRKKLEVNIKEFEGKRKEFAQWESEIEELRKYKKAYCPFIPAIRDGLWNVKKSGYHNKVLHRAIEARINHIRELQLELNVNEIHKYS